MHALIINQYGSPETFQYGEIAQPKIVKSKQILIKVQASGCNQAEILASSGKMKSLISLKFPCVLGLDVSGIVVETGKDVIGIKQGDEVYGQFKSMSFNGTHAEYVVMDQGVDTILHKPASISHVEAASIGTAAITAYEGIVNQCKILQGDGKRVLIVGAAGGVGFHSVSIAKVLGAHVTAICSTQNMDLVKSAGADVVIDYKSENFKTDLTRCEKFDCVMDTVGGDDYYFLVEPLIKQGGVYTTTVIGPNALGAFEKVSIFIILKALAKSKWRDLFGKSRYSVIQVLDQDQSKAYQILNNWFSTGQLKFPPIEPIPLREGASALSKLAKHKVVGKLVLVP